MAQSRILAATTCALLVLVMPPARAQRTLKIDGSTGAMPLVEALAKAHTAKTPTTKIEIGKGLGTKARIEDLKASSIDIAVAVASHGLKIDDLVKQGMVAHEIARTAVVFDINSSVPIINLSQAQVCAIYSGTTTNWGQAGGPDLVIAVHTRPDSEVDAEVVRDGIACLKTLKMPAAVVVMQRGGDMANELATMVGAIGMTTTTVVEQSGGKIRALALDGVEANISVGNYRLVREVFLVVRQPGSSEANAFLAFVQSPAGAAVIKANGAIPKAGN